ncbi:MAG: hypothetical protein U1F56_18450 [Rubrivivax sp.]
MLMIEPEVVLAAIENSERLSRLNRHLCRPLDRQQLPVNGSMPAVRDEEPDVDFDETH